MICFHFLRSEAEILHNEAWRVRTSPLLTELGEEAESGVIQGEKKKKKGKKGPWESLGMKDRVGAEGLGEEMAAVTGMMGLGKGG